MDTGRESSTARSSGWIWWVTGLVVVAVLGAAGTVIGLDSRVHNPAKVRAVAEEYVEAIASGDADRANSIAVIEPGTETDEILDSDALSNAERISNASVNRFRVDFGRGTASGRVSFELAGASYSDRIELEQGASGDWRVTSGLRYRLPYDFGASGALALEGMDEPVSDSGMATAYAGSYRVVSLNDLYEPVDSERMQLTPDAYMNEWAARVQPNEKFADAVSEELTEHYEGCAAARSVDEMLDCGIEIEGIDFGGVADDLAGDIRFSVDVVELPEFQLEGDEVGWGTVSGGGEFRISARGADAKGRTVDRETTGRAVYADLEVSVSGSEVSVELLPY